MSTSTTGTTTGSTGTAATPGRVVNRVLVIDDEPNHAEITAEILERDGHTCKVVTTGQAGLRQLREARWDLIITDLKMKDVDGMQILDTSRELLPDAEVILVTAHGTVDAAVKAMERGAFSFITKPVNMDELRSKASRALERAQMVRELRDLREMVDERFGMEGIIGKSPPMLKLFDTVRKVAPTNATVLITGDPGTGKELIAKAIHNNSPRRGRTFKAENCALFAENSAMLQSTLFGHVKGAFTGADRDKEGLFEYCNGGTLFLDEIGEMPTETQASLLRVLEGGEITRLGSNKSIRVDVRIVAATNRDLDEAVRQGRFRDDLYSRLRFLRLHLPPLSQRPGDIPLLAQHFLEEACREHHKEVGTFAPDAMNLLLRHHYPGNVRDLRALVHRIVIFADGPVITRDVVDAQLDDAPRGDGGHGGGSGAASGEEYDLRNLAGVTLKQVEEILIRNTLEREKHNRERTAKALGISERTLYRKIKDYGL